MARMPKRIEFPRLTRRDCERLLDVHQQLNRASDTLEHTSWTGGRAVSALIMSALVLLTELYNRAERAVLRGEPPPPGPSFQDGQVEQLAAAEPELAGPAPGSEPGK
jgi:hypothetical protein